ncbi:hypothetical protein [Alistipes indistinctus]|uniref:hypothetical protein n=1 Tax=Alistipes indistinctus TaxID=626932 RepID=UPI002673A939|nr:hypothetical protein [Alistipes indistinctus]
MTTIKMWAVFDPEGKPVEWSLRPNEEWCIEDFIGQSSWGNYEKESHTCRPVRVTIEEIKKPKTKNDE